MGGPIEPRDAQFRVVFRGYDRTEVDVAMSVFAGTLATERLRADQASDEVRRLRREMSERQFAYEPGPAAVAALRQAGAAADDIIAMARKEAEQLRADTGRLLEEKCSQARAELAALCADRDRLMIELEHLRAEVAALLDLLAKDGRPQIRRGASPPLLDDDRDQDTETVVAGTM